MAEEIVESPVELKTGMEKAALLLLSLSEDEAGSIIRNLEPKQVQTLGAAMAKVKHVDQNLLAEVYREFIEDIQKFSSIGIGSENFVKNTLIAALGEDKAGNLVDQILMGTGSKGLESLKWMDPRQVASIIRNEHPQIQTIVLSYLEPEHSAEILEQFPERTRLDLLMRISNLEEVQPAALRELNEIMEKQFVGQAGTQAAKIGGLKAAAEIMNFFDNSIESTLIDQIRDVDEEVAAQIEDLMFVFEDLIEIEDRGMQLLLREIPEDVLKKALKGADENLREKIYKNMSSRASEMLKGDLDAMPPIKVTDVEQSQKEILAVARRLADAGELMLGGGGAEQYL